MMNLSIILAILPSVVASFISTSKITRCISSFSLSYANSNDDGDVVHVSSSLHQPIPSPFLSLGQTETDWKEWQYSFGRNGLTDFLPQFSGHLSCLAIDLDSGKQQYDPSHLISGNTIESITQLPWQYGDDESEQATTSISTNISVSTRSSDKEKDTQLGVREDYDCILDSGVMNEIISSIPSTVTWHSRNGPPALLDLVKLMAEATQSIREFGIYVAITNHSIPDNAKDYLDQMGEVMGLEWTYDLDGLTKEGYSVSVARKYFTGLVNVGSDRDDLGTTSDMKQLKP